MFLSEEKSSIKNAETNSGLAIIKVTSVVRKQACVQRINYYLFLVLCIFWPDLFFPRLFAATLTLIQPYKDEHVSLYPNNTADVDNQEFSEQFKYADIKHTTSFLQDRRNSLKFIKLGAYSFPL